MCVPSSPSSGVLSHEELREALAKESAPLMQARATYDFDPQNERELQFKKVWQLILSLPHTPAHTRYGANTYTHTHTHTQHTHTFPHFSPLCDLTDRVNKNISYAG